MKDSKPIAAFQLVDPRGSGSLDGAAVKLDEYHRSLGRATASWNMLHYMFFQMYEFTLPPLERSCAADQWYKRSHDGNQRKLLANNIENDLHWMRDAFAFATVVRLVLVDTANLQERRNSIVHAPCSAVSDDHLNWVVRYYEAENPKWSLLAGGDAIASIDSLNQETQELCFRLAPALQFT